ncbi:MAG: amidohydrolase family protein [Chloroflexota bacterium]
MIVDAHVHLFPPDTASTADDCRARDPWFSHLYGRPGCAFPSVDDLLASMDAAGIDSAVVCGFPWWGHDDCRRHNDFFLELATRERDRLRLLASIQPRAGQAAVDELRRCLAGGLAGWGEVNADGQGFSLAEPDLLDELMSDLRRQGTPMLLHCSEPVGHSYPGKGRTTPDKVYAFARSYPENVLVCAHWGGGLPFYYLMPEMAGHLHNVYYDTAATRYLYRSHVFSIASRLVGADRIVFGSDYPLLGQSKSLAHARSAGLGEDDLLAVLGENARRLFWPA